MEVTNDYFATRVGETRFTIEFTRDEAQQGAFATAVGADQSHASIAMNRPGEILENGFSVIDNAYAVQIKNDDVAISLLKAWKLFADLA